MYDRILVPTDGSETATAALEHAGDLAAAVGATVHVLHVGDGDDTVDTTGAAIAGDGRTLVDDRGAHAIEDVRGGDPTETILETARDATVDAIVMGSCGRAGLERLVLGSVTEGVVRESPVPVIVVGADGHASHEYPYRHVTIATDGSEAATAAVTAGVSLAREHDAAVHLLSVADVPPEDLESNGPDDTRIGRLESGAREAIERAEEFASEAGLEAVTSEVRFGEAAEEIRAGAAESEADLLVVGTSGRGGLSRMVLGSVAEDVLRTAEIPVLTVRASDGDE
ncbi:universal stress protein [Natronobiforma cellulositropha]|uniref:universal stress protein n=1 Tax=Natronobiforma cellulositropha TaxID=1679076 RepID=UPI0021D5BBA7|nr:universal stress protein [Natronobiforma cellulositropha]